MIGCFFLVYVKVLLLNGISCLGEMEINVKLVWKILFMFLERFIELYW